MRRPKDVVATLGIIFGTVGLAPGCSSDAPDDPVDCSSLCQQLQARGCELSTSVGAGGATQKGPGGCLDSCHQALSLAVMDGCTEEWNRYTACLSKTADLTCNGSTMEDIQGCDAERTAWDSCDGTECDLAGGLTGQGTTSDQRPYTLSYAWARCACQPGTELGLGELGCGAEATCPEVCCCGGAVVARVCIADACVTGEEACAVLEAPPYSLCGVP